MRQGSYFQTEAALFESQKQVIFHNNLLGVVTYLVLITHKPSV